MVLSLPIPTAARPVMEILRRDVKRPEMLPALTHRRVLRWTRAGRTICPMGLHKASLSLLPHNTRNFAGGEAAQAAVDAFAEWWDEQNDALHAANQVWPPYRGALVKS